MYNANTPPDEPPVEITSEMMGKWNRLIDFAKKKGYAGKKELDHDVSLRKKVFSEFNKENPNDAIDEGMVKHYQNEIQKYKQKALGNIKAHPESFKGGEGSFMPTISQVDNIFGQKTSQWKFPEAYLIDKQTGEKKKLGFAPKVDMSKVLTKK